jgi:hypothetical protein
MSICREGAARRGAAARMLGFGDVWKERPGVIVAQRNKENSN